MALKQTKNLKHLFVAIHDFVAAFLAVTVAYMLRLESFPTGFYLDPLLTWGTAFAIITAISYRFLGITQRLWAYASFNEFFLIAGATTFAILIWIALLFLSGEMSSVPRPVPRSVPIIVWFTACIFLMSPRVLYRYYRENRHQFKRMIGDKDGRVGVLVIGTGDRAISYLRICTQPESSYKIMGLIDQKGTRINSIIYGVPVVSSLENLEKYLELNAKKAKDLKELVLATSLRELGPDKLEYIMGLAIRFGLIFKRIPPLSDMATQQKINPRAVQIVDLLDRREIDIDRNILHNGLRGKRIVVTGGCGSIGSELVSQILKCDPAQLLVIDNSEFAIYDASQNLNDAIKSDILQIVLADVRDEGRIQDLLNGFKPDIVFHAAALKHVPIVEANPLEGIKTNLIGTINVANAARKAKASSFILISTDKAVNATNVMGATKRLAEIYVQCLDREVSADDTSEPTKFMVVRFGNVLRSSGSVVPLFEKQIEQGGPITVTHKDIKRYFMTIHEAVSLVLLAVTQQPKTAHTGNIKVLNMGEPVSILQLARKMILLVGLLPDQDIKIDITGLRAGEKLSEELFDDQEEAVQTDDPNLYEAISRKINYDDFKTGLANLNTAIESSDEHAATDRLLTLVPGYSPSKN